MGVPALFRWLANKYPKIVERVIEEQPVTIQGTEIPVDLSKQNPNGTEFDNLYLDMNGIVHPCCHPENKVAPATENEMMIEIFKYTERIIAMVRPRKLLYLALDGVAPRAKMNQQRSRRFRTAKESREKLEDEERLISDLKASGKVIDPASQPKKEWDSNCITPGTPFMSNLATCLRYWIADKLNTDPGWKNLKVILSDANVPGEGEHKIMDFIRSQRTNPNHDPNTRHVIYGLDADLIMLSLATHEPHFKVLREDVFFNEGIIKGCFVCGQTGHQANQCLGKPKQKQGEFDEKGKVTGIKPYVFLDVQILREYLEIELNVPSIPFPFDLENALDDWVFLCFFVGNDFLPHLPSLEIREGAIDTLTTIWKKILPIAGDYLTKNGRVQLNCVQHLVTELGFIEDDIFRRRRERIPILPVRGVDPNVRAQSNSDLVANRAAVRLANIQVADSLRAELNGQILPSKQKEDSAAGGTKRKADEMSESGLEATDDSQGTESTEKTFESQDTVRLWEPGFKERYYRSKFHVELSDTQFRREVVKNYVEGLCWVLQYYFQGVPSWKWYYPYHYAPFASDFVDIADINIKFDLGKPFKPFEQLMGVLPAASKEHLPKALAQLMIDKESEINDFYPEDFEIDLNGKKFAWQGVALLPFIEESRLLAALEKVYPNLNEEETNRNSNGSEILCFGNKHKLYEELCPLYGKRNSDEPVSLKPESSGKLFGFVSPDPDCIPGSTFYSPLTEHNMPDIVNDKSLSVLYTRPPKIEEWQQKSILLPNVKFSPRVLNTQDHEFVRNGNSKRRDQGGRRGFVYQNNRQDINRSAHERQEYGGSRRNTKQGWYQGPSQQQQYTTSHSGYASHPYDAQRSYSQYYDSNSQYSTYNSNSQSARQAYQSIKGHYDPTNSNSSQYYREGQQTTQANSRWQHPTYPYPQSGDYRNNDVNHNQYGNNQYNSNNPPNRPFTGYPPHQPSRR
ncbi:hypothetical protein G9A89_005752 [Geosiphon pyriformis]|nr:hypothetical protein G9A89_005752 [Geosiphon pyriformis]